MNHANAVARCPAVLAGTHLATFETTEEIENVVDELPLPMAVKAWTGVVQLPTALSVNLGWVNRIGSKATSLPNDFPWRSGEPNDLDADLPIPLETHEEDFADLSGEKTFDDADAGRMNQVLCECTPAEEEEVR